MSISFSLLTLLIADYINEFLMLISQVRVVVYGASANYEETSLNENILPGLDLLNNLVSVLTRFQQDIYVGMTKQMFYQVKIPLVETDALRFL